MPNWKNTNTTNAVGDDIKIVSREKIEDTNPELYRKRGRAFADKGMYAAAEQEYDKAIKYSGGKLKYYFGKFFCYIGGSQYMDAFSLFLEITWIIAWKRIRFVFWFLVAIEFLTDAYVLSYFLMFFGMADLGYSLSKNFGISWFRYMLRLCSIIALLILNLLIFMEWLQSDFFYALGLLGLAYLILCHVVATVKEIMAARK